MKATFCMFFLLQKEFSKQILRDFLERLLINLKLAS